MSSKKSTVKIIGGSWKRKNVFFHDADGLRPTLNRVRETLFNWLGQDLSGKSCLDLFSGSGILGFESLSRNAQSCILVDNNTFTISSLIDNKNNLNAKNALIVNTGLALQFLSNGKFKATNHRVIWNKTKRMSIPFFFEPSYDFKMSHSFLSKTKRKKNDGIIFEKFLNKSLKKFIEYQR